MSWHVGDEKPDLVVEVLTKPRRDGGVGLDLTGRSVRVHIVRPDGTRLTKTGSPDNQTTNPGRVIAAWAADGTDLNAVGTYVLQVELDHLTAPQTIGDVAFVVEPSRRP